MVKTMCCVGVMVGGLGAAMNACNDSEHVVDNPGIPDMDAAVFDATAPDAAPPPVIFYVDCGKGSTFGNCTKNAPCNSIPEALRHADFNRKTVIIAAPRNPFSDIYTYNVEVRSAAFETDMGLCVAP